MGTQAAQLGSWAAAAAPALWAATVSALSAAFMALRLALYAILVCVAYVRIIEEEVSRSKARGWQDTACSRECRHAGARQGSRSWEAAER